MVTSFSFDPDHPLKRCQGESGPAYVALLDYHHLGFHRSLRGIQDLYRSQRGNQAGTSEPPTCRMATLAKWSVQNHWQDRIEAEYVLQRARERKVEDDARKKEEERRLSALEWVHPE